MSDVFNQGVNNFQQGLNYLGSQLQRQQDIQNRLTLDRIQIDVTNELQSAAKNALDSNHDDAVNWFNETGSNGYNYFIRDLKQRNISRIQDPVLKQQAELSIDQMYQQSGKVFEKIYEEKLKQKNLTDASTVALQYLNDGNATGAMRVIDEHSVEYGGHLSQQDTQSLKKAVVGQYDLNNIRSYAMATGSSAIYDGVIAPEPVNPGPNATPQQELQYQRAYSLWSKAKDALSRLDPSQLKAGQTDADHAINQAKAANDAQWSMVGRDTLNKFFSLSKGGQVPISYNDFLAVSPDLQQADAVTGGTYYKQALDYFQSLQSKFVSGDTGNKKAMDQAYNTVLSQVIMRQQNGDTNQALQNFALQNMQAVGPENYLKLKGIIDQHVAPDMKFQAALDQVKSVYKNDLVSQGQAMQALIDFRQKSNIKTSSDQASFYAQLDTLTKTLSNKGQMESFLKTQQPFNSNEAMGKIVFNNKGVASQSEQSVNAINSKDLSETIKLFETNQLFSRSTQDYQSRLQFLDAGVKAILTPYFSGTLSTYNDVQFSGLRRGNTLTYAIPVASGTPGAVTNNGSQYYVMMQPYFDSSSNKVGLKIANQNQDKTTFSWVDFGLFLAKNPMFTISTMRGPKP